MARRLQHVSELHTEPVVGTRYRVPCIWAHRGWDASWWPILGPQHADPDLGVDMEHFHYDWRFIPADLIEATFSPAAAKDPSRAMGQVVTDWSGAVQLRVLECVRPMPQFPALRPIEGDLIPWLGALESRYVTARLKCRTCPHRGMPLDGLPADEQGRVICPGHGLRWDLATGELAPRVGVTP